MDRTELMPIALASAVALILGLILLLVLPATVLGLPTPVLVLGAIAGAFICAVRWL